MAIEQGHLLKPLQIEQHPGLQASLLALKRPAQPSGTQPVTFGIRLGGEHDVPQARTRFDRDISRGSDIAADGDGGLAQAWADQKRAEQ